MQNLQKEKYKDYFEGKKYNITTFGCQMNEHDSERISYILEDLGYTCLLYTSPSPRDV